MAYHFYGVGFGSGIPWQGALSALRHSALQGFLWASIGSGISFK